MHEDKYTHCKQAMEDKETIQRMIIDREKNGIDVPVEMLINAMYNMMVCKWEMPGNNREDWKDWHRDVEGAVYPEDGDSHHMVEYLTDEQMKTWVSKMYHSVNGTKQMGEHWTKEQTTAVGMQNGVMFDEISEMDFYTTLNAMWHDHYNSAVMANMVGEPKFFVELAKDFLFDDDSYAPKEKLARYYKYIMKH